MNHELAQLGPLERTLHLRTLPLFDGLASGPLAVIAQLIREDFVSRGQVLYEQGDVPSRLHIVVDGTVRDEYDGREIERREAPAVAGLHGIFGGTGTCLRGVAETDLSVLSIDRSAYLDVLEDRFDVFLHLRQSYAQRVTTLQQTLGAFFVPLPMRVDEFPRPRTSSDIVERLLCIHSTGLFGEFPISALAQIIDGDAEFLLGEGEPLWHRGEQGEFMLVLTSGEVLCAADDSRATFRAGPGYALGAEAGFGGVGYGYDAVATKPVTGIRIDAAILTDIIEDHFEVGLRILAHFAREEVRLLKLRATAAA